MAVVKQAATVTDLVRTTSVSSRTVSVTVANGANRFLAVRLGWFDISARAITGVTYSGIALSLIKDSPAGTDVVSSWGLASPPVGTANLVVTFDGAFSGDSSNSIALFADVLNGVAAVRASVTNDFASTTTPSVTVTGSLTGDFLSALCKFFSGGTPTATAVQNLDGVFDGSTHDNYIASNATAAAPNGTVNWTFSEACVGTVLGLAFAPATFNPFRVSIGAMRV